MELFLYFTRPTQHSALSPAPSVFPIKLLDLCLWEPTPAVSQTQTHFRTAWVRNKLQGMWSALSQEANEIAAQCGDLCVHVICLSSPPPQPRVFSWIYLSQQSPGTSSTMIKLMGCACVDASVSSLMAVYFPDDGSPH